MYLQYGNYVHQANQLRVQQRGDRYLRTPRGEKYALLATVFAQGALKVDDQADAVSKVNTLKNAYKVDGLKLSWHYNDGTETPLGLSSVFSFNGTKVIMPPTLDNPDPTQWATYVYYSLAVEVMVDLYPAGETFNPNPVVSFTETVAPTGNGGPIHVLVPQDQQRWQFQRSRRFSPVTATQSGTLVTLNNYSLPPRPLWPASPPFQGWRSTDPNKPQRVAPKKLGPRVLEFPISWTYHFEFNAPLADRLPNLF